MGRKRARKVEHLFFHITCGMILLIGLWGCAHHPTFFGEPQRRARAILSSAANDAAQGDFDRALEKNEFALRHYFEIIGDRALYQRGLFYIHPKNQKKNPAKSIDYFGKLKTRFPESRLGTEAETWVTTLTDLEQKNQAIKVLKTEAQKNQSALARIAGENDTLRTRITELETEKNSLENQIEKLKNVDLGIEQKKREAAGQSPH